MIAILSPAKTLDYDSPLPALPQHSMPRLPEATGQIARGAARLGAAKLATLMKISPKLAELNARRYREFDDAPERPALLAFAGDVYTGFDTRSLEEPGFAFAQDHVRILSGLYGLLRPMDAIRPYRLEMGTRWAPGRASDLYGFWGTRIAQLLAQDVAASGDGVVLNLASQEYWHAVAGKLPEGVRVIDIDFRENGPDGPRFVSFHAKRARGMMARWMCEHRVTDIEAMQGFDSDGYSFAGAEGDRWTFVRG